MSFLVRFPFSSLRSRSCTQATGDIPHHYNNAFLLQPPATNFVRLFNFSEAEKGGGKRYISRILCTCSGDVSTPGDKYVLGYRPLAESVTAKLGFWKLKMKWAVTKDASRRSLKVGLKVGVATCNFTRYQYQLQLQTTNNGFN
jgi:hypothetical protein